MKTNNTDFSNHILDTLNFLSIGFYRSTREGELLYANDAFVKILGYNSFRELSTLDIARQLYKDKSQRDAFIEDIEKNGEVHAYEYALKRQDNSPIFIRENARVVREENSGEVLYYEGTIEDVSRNKNMEDELQSYHENLEKMIKKRTAELADINRKLIQEMHEREEIEKTLKRETELMNILMDNIPDAIYFKDTKSRFIRINTALSKVLNIQVPEDAVGKTDAHFFSKVHAEEAKLDEKQIIRKGEPIIGKIEQDVRDDGWTRWVSTTKVPFRDVTNRIVGIVGISRDISDLKHAEDILFKKNKELSVLTEEFKRSNRDLEQFAAIASHDLQEPLRMVSSYVELLKRKNKDTLDETSQSYIQYAVDGVRHMARLIDDLLEYSRISTRDHTIEQTDLNEILERVVTNLSRLIENRNARIHWSNLPTVEIDANQIEHLFQNLIQNGIKYNQSAQPTIHVDSLSINQNWRISVSDNGIGIDSRYNQKIFGIFQRLFSKEEYEGTGIGLALCQRIIERHGGSIWVESEPGKGSTFIFKIPKIQDKCV